MRYFQSQRHFRREPPKRSWWRGLFSRKTKPRVVVQKSEMVGRFANPYKRVSARKKLNIPYKTIASVTVFIAWIGVMLYTPYFQITKTEYHGLKIIKHDEIDSFVRQNFLNRGRFWPEDTYFLVSANSIEKKLDETFALNNVTVEKVFPSTLKITLEEKISSIIYDNGSGYFLLDGSGAVLKKILLSGAGEGSSVTTTASTTPRSPTSTQILANLSASSTLLASTTTLLHVPNFAKISQEYAGYPIIYDSRERSVEERAKNVLPAGFIAGVLDIANSMRRTKLVSIKYMTTADPNAGIDVYTDRAWKIKMNPLLDSEAQIENVKTIVQTSKPIEYVDVRFGERVYWK
jgi:hypothetical protein